MEKTIEIPEGYEARIEGGKVILERKENEDERIRKWIIDEIKATHDYDSPTSQKIVNDAIAYLERQKEQENGKELLYVSQKSYNLGLRDGRMEQKPAEWSEEDEKMIERLIRHTQKEYNELCNDRYGHQEIISDLKKSCRERMNWLENRLKSLRPSWKPSEEQISALERAIVKMHTVDDIGILAELRDNLKKL